MYTDFHVNSTEYEREFWNAARGKGSVGKLDAGKHNMTGTYKLPAVSMKKYKAALLEETPFRSLATIVSAPGSDTSIRTYDAEDIATWLGEKTLEYYDSEDAFNTIRVATTDSEQSSAYPQISPLMKNSILKNIFPNHLQSVSAEPKKMRL